MNDIDSNLKQFIINEYSTWHFNYDEDKDIYANFVSQAFNIPYEECLEWKDNKPFPLGKLRRTMAKDYMIHRYMIFKGGKEKWMNLM